ncbi:lipopolysaccharide biosynthesis protein, partial [Enterococcus faecalis]
YYADLNCELWSFDIGDCEKYQMHFNNQFIDETKVVASQADPKYQSDVCFIGVDKQRLSYLLELEAYFVECNLNPFIYV